ncbi:MAG: aminotransferase class V-fold PLP-dependent enzyme [Bacteroidota bacterium]
MNPKLIQRLRAETPGAAKRIHLNNAGASFMPDSVIHAIKEYIQLEAVVGGYEAHSLKIDHLNSFFTSLATLLNTQKKNIAYAASATDAYNKALLSIDFQAGDSIVTTEDDYVSNQIAFLQLTKFKGVKVLHARTHPTGGVDLEDIHKLISQHHPKLVAVTHVPTNSGLVQDVQSVGEFCKETGAFYLIDACQSAGQLPLDVKQLNCDFLSATFRKYMRGPRGTGFLYISDRILNSNAQPMYLDLHSAEWTSSNSYEVSKDAKRFELWERPHALVAGCIAAAELILELGISNIEKQVKSIAAYTRAQLEKLEEVTVLDQGTELCGITTIAVKKQEGELLKQKLRDKNINTSIVYKSSAHYDFEKKQVDWCLRVSPHYYNTKEEINEFVEVLKKTLN